MPNPRHEAGVSLIEVLVAIVVFSLGLLGIAGLQATSLKNNYSAYVHSQAAQSAYDMADRMRANRQVARSGAYNRIITAAAPTCDGTNLVACDQAEWLADIAALPQGTGGISVADDVVTIQVQWNDSRAGGSATASLTVETQL